MNSRKLSQHMFGLALVLLLLAACGTSEPAPPPTPTEGIAESETVLEVTFDGKECTCSGPEIVSPGQITLILHNQSEEEGEVMLNFMRLEEGKSWDDLLTYLGPIPSTDWPPWLSTAGIIQTGSKVASVGETISNEVTVTSGNYAMLCVRLSPARDFLGAWPAAPLTVGG